VLRTNASSPLEADFRLKGNADQLSSEMLPPKCQYSLSPIHTLILFLYRRAINSAKVVRIGKSRRNWAEKGGGVRSYKEMWIGLRSAFADVDE